MPDATIAVVSDIVPENAKAKAKARAASSKAKVGEVHATIAVGHISPENARTLTKGTVRATTPTPAAKAMVCEDWTHLSRNGRRHSSKFRRNLPSSLGMSHRLDYVQD